ncbi:MAG: DUF2855 family protein [Solirubrobacterales bacterium]
MSETITDFLVDREDLASTDVGTRPGPALADREVLLELQRFGFSANNITYATLGDAMGYWRFFPAGDGSGSVPVWGYAIVRDSQAEGVEPGFRYFGYFPLSTHLVAQPRKVSPRGFIDGAAHRVELPPVYQRYVRAADDPDQALEDQQALWRPLFTTSYGAADFIKENDAYGASTVVMTSASSKTALGTAFCLHELGSEQKLVGLTSPGNVEFCERAGYYDRVVAYDDLAELEDDSQILVDFAGNESILNGVAEQVGDQLRRTVIVGATHWQDRERELTDLPPGSDFFFLPIWIEKRRADWGPTEFFERSDSAWNAFAPTTEGWLTIQESRGVDGIETVYRSTLSGECRPETGHVLQF